MKKIMLSAFADEASPTLDGQLAALQENGIGLIELRGVAGKNPATLTQAEVREIGRRLAAAEIGVWSIGSPIGKVPLTDPFEPHFDLFRRTLDCAVILGARCLRLFSFYPGKAGWQDKTASLEPVCQRLARFLEAAAGSGVILCHENEKGIFGDDAPSCAALHRALPGLSAVFDPANFLQCAQATLPAWELLSQWVLYLHIKDARPDGSVVPAGFGAGELPAILRRFSEAPGAYGVLSVEPHLSVFDGRDRLELPDERSRSADDFAYSDSRTAFDAAVNALKALLAAQ